jgi:hypothetical protein
MRSFSDRPIISQTNLKKTEEGERERNKFKENRRGREREREREILFYSI